MVTTLIDAWIASLDDDEYDSFIAALGYLRDNGPAAGRPYVDTLTLPKNALYKNMKELRPPVVNGAHMRVLFAFDLQSKAIMLVAGDKAGNWDGWYTDNIPTAQRLFGEHQDAIRQEIAELEQRNKTTKPGKPRRKGKKK